MKHLKLFPLLIAAAFCLPRAHAAGLPAKAVEAGASVAMEGLHGYSLLLVGLGVMLLAGRSHRMETFKPAAEL